MPSDNPFLLRFSELGAYRLFPIFSNMFSVSNCEVLGLLIGDPALASFTPPSNDLLAVSPLSKTLKECSTTGTSGPTSSNTFADDFRRANAFGNLGMKYGFDIENYPVRCVPRREIRMTVYQSSCN
jgi:hypothetical protein